MAATPIIRTRTRMRSYQTRQQHGQGGVRRIDRTQMTSTTQNSNGLWSKIVNWGKGIVNWAITKITEVISKINVTAITQWAIALFDGAWQFNWDISDEQIDKNIINLQGQLISQTAGLLGNTLGKIVCGALPTAAIAYFNQAAAIHIARTQGVGVLAELASAYGTFITGAYFNYQKQRLWAAYKNVRKALKSALLSDNPISQKIVSVIPGGRATLQGWGDNKVEDWSFQSQRQKARNKLPEEWNGQLNTLWNQDSSEEFWDEFSDSCKDSLIALAQGIDDFIGLQKIQEQRDNQLVRTTVRPDGRDGEEITIFSRARDVFTNTVEVLNTRQLLENRDMGSYLGQPWDEIPITENIGIQLTLVFYNYEKPPYWTKERRKNLAKTEIVLPNVKKTMVDWDKLKNDFGKSSPFTKGSIKGQVNLSNGRNFAFYASTENEIENTAKLLDSYLEPNIVYPIRFSNHKGRGQNPNTKYIETKKMYFSHFYILNWEKVNKYIEYQQNGITGQYIDPRKKKVKVQMHLDQKPSYYDSLIREALKSSLEMNNQQSGTGG